MKTNEVTNAENDMQGMFFCWTQVSRRMEKTQTLAEWGLKNWLLENVVHRVVDAKSWKKAVRKIEERMERANRTKNDNDLRLQLDYGTPDEVCSGYVRIWRQGDAKACINIPVIDWRGTASGSEEREGN